MKYIRQICSVLLALCLFCMTFVTAYAHEVPDGNRKGAITVKMEYDGKAVTGGTLTAYRVGRLRESNGNYSFGKTDATAAFTGSYEDITSAELAESVAAFVEENKVPAYGTAKNQNGKAVFSDLELGLYLIVQTDASEGYEPLVPFLISVPMNEDGHYVYEVSAEGKFQLEQEQEPDTPAAPSVPSGPTLPQTGQLNWPIPVLAALGLCLFSVGWALRFGRKKNGYER